jgi:hypothetical protein
MRLWRTIISVFLLLLFAVPLFFLSFLQLQQLYIKHTLEERLETGLLKTIFIPQQDWKGMNRGEIVIDGKLFDVAEVRREANGITVTGIFDDEETAVVQHLDKSCSATNAKDIPVFAQFFQLLDGLFFQANTPQHNLTEASSKLFQNLIVHFPQLYREVLSPPPQVCA